MKTKWIVLGITCLILLPGIVFGLKILLFPLRIANTAIDSAGNIIDKTLDADNVIYNYEWFKQTYEDVEAFRRKLELADEVVQQFKIDAGVRKEWGFEDKQEYARLNTTKLGLANVLRDTIANYNARARMVNRKIFRGNLPEKIEE